MTKNTWCYKEAARKKNSFSKIPASFTQDKKKDVLYDSKYNPAPKNKRLTVK